jgi:hypothetical protein
LENLTTWLGGMIVFVTMINAEHGSRVARSLPRLANMLRKPAEIHYFGYNTCF